MAGIVHEVENADLLAQVRQESPGRPPAGGGRPPAQGADCGGGCSTSEVVGRRVGSCPRRRWGQAIFDPGLHSVFGPMGVYIRRPVLRDRALIVEHEAVPQLDIVNVVPQPKGRQLLCHRCVSHLPPSRWRWEESGRRRSGR